MTYIAALVAAALLSLAGAMFDFDAVQALPIPYPLVSLALGGGCIAVFLSYQSSRLVLSRPVAKIGLIFLLIYLIGLVSSLFSGVGDILALGMKSATFFMNFLFLVFGASLYGTRLSLKFSKYFLFLSVVLALILPMAFGSEVNKNWLGITVTFSYLIYWLYSDKPGGELNFFIGLFALAAYSIFVLGARGVFAACFLSSLYIVITWVYPGNVKLWANRLVFVSMPLCGIVVSGLGILLFKSPYYTDLVTWSIQATGKNLDSSRLERWYLGFDLFKEKPLIGWGVDAHIARATTVSDMGDLHNLWWEYLFRFGLFGAGLLFCIFIMTSRLLYLGHKSTVDVVAYFVIFTFLSVYALGGVTHWPGAYMFWFVVGVLISRSDKRIVR